MIRRLNVHVPRFVSIKEQGALSKRYLNQTSTRSYMSHFDQLMLLR